MLHGFFPLAGLHNEVENLTANYSAGFSNWGLFVCFLLCTFLSPAKEKYQKKRRQREKPRFLPLGTHFLSWWRTRCLCTALIAPEVTYTKSAELLPSVATNSVAQRTRETGRCSHQEKENCNFPFGESQIKISQPSSKPLPSARLP
jgi:hypothetical protein